MKKILYTLLAATSLMSASFAAASTESDSPTSERSAVSIINDETVEAFAFGAPVPKFHYDPNTERFIGSELKFKVGPWPLTIQSNPLSLTTQNSINGYSQILNLAPPSTLRSRNILELII